MISHSIATVMAMAIIGTCMFPHTSKAFYVPGIAPKNYQIGEEIPLKVNAMTSIHTQLPKDYYRLPFCKPQGGPKMASESLGEFLTGNKIQNSPFSIHMQTDVYCRPVCSVTLSKLQTRLLQKHILYGYNNNWIVDNLNAASIGVTLEGESARHYAGGFPIGFMDIASDSKDAYIFNHVNIMLDYHNPAEDSEGFRVVGFAVEPMSVSHKYFGNFIWDGESKEGFTNPLETCPNSGTHMTKAEIRSNQKVEEGVDILYTYDVIWNYSEVAWSSRWDIYLSEDDLVPPQVHWYSITNSILVVLFLSLLVVSILVRNLRRDIAGYNAIAVLTDEEKEEEADEIGWKLIHADVFRPPSSNPMLYCVLVGSGVQLCITFILTIILSAVGFVNPARRGSLMIALLLIYMLFGSLAGYVSSRLYKAFRGRSWQLCTILTATLFPGLCFFIFLFFNIVLFFFKSSGSAPFIDVLIVAAMWCCVSIPLVFIGAYMGFKTETITFPTVTSTIARAIPEPDLMLNPNLSMTMAGLIPFAAAYVELFFIMTSLWMDQYYYVFGFTLIVFLILLVTSSEVTLLLLYYQLCSENHRWWWFSFLCSGCVGMYMFAYSFVWFRALEASKLVITYLLYFGYMFLLCFAISLVTGSVGALTSLWFVRKIFSTIKVD